MRAPAVSVVQIARDPFARWSLMRERWPRGGSCAWCEQPGRFVYWWEDDSGRQRATFAAKIFCSVGCYRAFYGV
jgi:hypothetical protein